VGGHLSTGIMEKNGMIERRKDGIMGYWNNGMVGKKRNGIMNFTKYFNIPIVFLVYPIFQSSRLMWGYPIFQYSKGGIYDSQTHSHCG
jgi:hypothetical protein